MRGSGIDSPEARSAAVRVLVDRYFLDADATELLAEAGLLARNLSPGQRLDGTSATCSIATAVLGKEIASAAVGRPSPRHH
jgi:hypothetical protein